MDATSGRSGPFGLRDDELAPPASEADADPPGLSTLNTMARTESSFRACRMYSMSVSEPAPGR